MNYKILHDNGIQRLSDGAVLPVRFEDGQLVALDQHSPFVKELREWIAASNVLQAADPVPTPQPPEPDAKAILRALVKKGIITDAEIRAEIR